MNVSKARAVIVVDVQADFTQYCSGALAVPDTGRDYVAATIKATKDFKKSGLPILATRDYHPADHISFFTSHPGKKPLDVIRIGDRDQVLWPPHCVQDTPGAAILIPSELITAVVSTGDRSEFESYSGFRDDGGRDTGLKELLEKVGARNLIVFGLATDYCVKATVLHALEDGFRVTLVSGLSRGITPEGTEAALAEMEAAGAEIKA
ncbi:MAG: isochorismatase family protein [Desulfomonile tiedjei]|uniref:nicotinamidase n=1 Tax=Desulfomonile tiedjei TaxID=2358 RepID=A0A9D6V3S5_9BACT|nr:isochorismatase family protein [Desulfomonile tiedjei]